MGIEVISKTRFPSLELPLADPWKGRPVFLKTGSFFSSPLFEKFFPSSRPWKGVASLGIFSPSRHLLARHGSEWNVSFDRVYFRNNENPKTPPTPRPIAKASPAKSQGGPYIITYSPDKNPFEVNDKIRRIAREIYHQGGDLVQDLFNRLRVGGPEKLVVRTDYNFGRSAIETLETGGDCSDLSNLTIATIQELNRLGAKIRGGAVVLRFDHFPPNMLHMVPFVIKNGKKILVDLQASRLNQTAQGKYEVVQVFPGFDEAASLYHAEWGMYFVEQGEEDKVIPAYTKAVEIYDGYPIFRENLAKAHLKKINERTQEAFKRHQWDQCIALSHQALPYIKQIPQSEQPALRKDFEYNIKVCLQNKEMRELTRKLQKAVDSGYRYLMTKEWSQCVDHYSQALQLNARRPQDDDTRELDRQIRHNQKVCKDHLR